LKILSSLIGLLSSRDWVYSLSLLVPFAAYNLALKACDLVASQSSGDSGLTQTLHLMQSNIFFNVGYSLLWIGLFAIARRKLQRWTVVLLFHLSTMLLVIVTTCAHWYFRETGTTLDYGIIALWLPQFREVMPVLAYRVPLSAWVLLFATLLYTVLGPSFLTRAVSRWRGWTGTSPSRAARVSSLGSLVLFLLALGFGSLSLLSGATALARDPLVNLVLTGIRETTTEEAGVEDTTAEVSEPGADSITEYPATDASLAQTPEIEKRNVVLIHLESARARSVTPYNENLNTMPFLNELAKSSLLAEHARVVVPRSSKGSTAINCGIEPALFPGPEYEPGGIPAPCLASLLKEQDYRTVWFQSLWNTGDDSSLAENFGYEEFYPSQSMNTEGFQVTNTFGYEEDIMLEPSEEWLSAKGYDKPFLAQYFTGTGHYGYECLPNRYGYEYFSGNEELDRYHNCLRMLDHFLKNLFDQYKELGLYENTIFVMYGDHGEGFREHGRYMHGDNPYEEGLRVPLLIHAPGRFESGERAKGLSSQIDILPTVLDILGYEVEKGAYPGYSLLHPLPEDRTLMSSCVYPYRCMASLKGTEKYIYHYGDQPDELFDLSEDPLEERNLAGERDEKELDKRRNELLAWASRLDAEYGSFPVPPP
jgi:lipoteichoic acid synthase